MNWLEFAVWLIALVVVCYNFYYERKFLKEEGDDERADIIKGLSSRQSFAYVSMLISLLILADLLFQFSFQVYKLLVAVILIGSNVASFVTLSRIRKNY
ncbi:hypothetical protein [Paenibacillus humicola]|uniref:hypothetical protein n=1 Tax=Paenibacillus humicola TaxID=3110540 RepID=UPI00237AB498|nr:hypothetical protein [Paenibacillus humicola]